MAGIAFNQLEELLIESPDLLPEPQLAELQQTIENIAFRDWVKLEGERAMLHDVIQRIYTDDGDGDGRITPAGLNAREQVSFIVTGNFDYGIPEIDEYRELVFAARKAAEPATLFVFASRKETTETADALLDVYKEEMAKPFWDSKDLQVDEFLKEHRWKFSVLNMLFPALDAIRRATDRTVGRQEGVVAAIAFQRHFLKYGRWPESMDQVRRNSSPNSRWTRSMVSSSSSQ